jgi:hypothetical protein
LEEIVADVRLREGGGNDSGGNNSGGNSSGGGNSGGGNSGCGSGVDNDQAVVFPYSRIVFIDSTWNQCRGIHIDQRIAGQYFSPAFPVGICCEVFWIKTVVWYGRGATA